MLSELTWQLASILHTDERSSAVQEARVGRISKHLETGTLSLRIQSGAGLSGHITLQNEMTSIITFQLYRTDHDLVGTVKE